MTSSLVVPCFSYPRPTQHLASLHVPHDAQIKSTAGTTYPLGRDGAEDQHIAGTEGDKTERVGVVWGEMGVRCTLRLVQRKNWRKNLRPTHGNGGSTRYVKITSQIFFSDATCAKIMLRVLILI